MDRQPLQIDLIQELCLHICVFFPKLITPICHIINQLFQLLHCLCKLSYSELNVYMTVSHGKRIICIRCSQTHFNVRCVLSAWNISLAHSNACLTAHFNRNCLLFRRTQTTTFHPCRGMMIIFKVRKKGPLKEAMDRKEKQLKKGTACLKKRAGSFHKRKWKRKARNGTF